MSDPSAAELPPAPPRAGPLRRWSGELPWLLVLALACWPPALWLLHAWDPEAVVRLSQAAAAGLRRGLLGSGALLLVACLVFPPVPAGLRLWAHRLRLQFTSDRGPLLRALGELQHFASAARHYEVGRLALQRGEVTLAGQHLYAALQLEPHHAGAQYQFGLLCLRLGQLQTAMRAFTAAEQIDPGHHFGDAKLHAGRACQLLGNAVVAASLLRHHQSRHGGNRRSHYWLGQALAELGDREGAAAAFAAAAQANLGPLTPEEGWYRALARVAGWRWRPR